MRRRDWLKGAAALLASSPGRLRAQARLAPGPVEPTMESLREHFVVPDWYRDAKLGMWAHWGPQCAPEAGDWYGRHLYLEGEAQAAIHRRLYGHPADHGFIDVIAGWRAEEWDPDAVFGAYKAAGARFLVGMACHHDNFDLFASPHPWNATRIGPGRDLVAGWAAAARRLDLPFGVSNHASHSWHWWQTAYGYDTVGPRAGERYDAWRLTAAEGAGTAWEGLDPQALYTGPRMVPPAGLESPEAMRRWHDDTSGQWIEAAPPGDPGYALHWLARQMQLVERYEPDFLYQDSHYLPFGAIGQMAAAHFYNRAIARTGAFTGVMSAGFRQGEGTLHNFERKAAGDILPEPWQAATCIGDWHYNRARFRDRSYVGAADVIRQLVDIVSKNGTLLLSVPVRGNGTLDPLEHGILAALGRWMGREGEAAIYGSRPWRVFGQEQGGGVRYTRKRETLSASLLDPQPGELALTSLGTGQLRGARIGAVRLVGGGPVPFEQRDDALAVSIDARTAGGTVPVLAIEGVSASFAGLAA
ncbi:alpha-L-fucosidase [Alteriqipengyuania lutimaris]|uniref:alpha-L-fucosidase n=1 Tax=Alteriqipengyuania lutimaris TaxID=1538146 RepID=A0A395LK65_9SPHN|nr:alpha-L-fucosidase [Alteriqipengyuania lutimaris]MBB3033939.1 alpha-L-fucosidase [Alteriqipengyuania lutimaris]RDS77105.1 alpha-L-fucosidase [Alteriqipengyuania lutimaris]